MYAKDILKQVRYSLSDPKAERWSDFRLLTLLDAGITDIARKTTLFVENTFYIVTDLVVDIDLSDRATKIIRAEYNDLPLPFYSFEEMDKIDNAWQLKTGDKVKAIVYDKQRNSLLKQYPIVSNAINDNITQNSPYGIITDISYSDIQVTLIDDAGDLGAIPDDAVIKFYYIRKHAKITDINDELNIDELVEQPLIHYVTGMALRDNMDVQNRQMGTEEIQLYSQMIDAYSIEKSHLFVRADNTVRYRPND